jgi:hypothetical protein
MIKGMGKRGEPIDRAGGRGVCGLYWARRKSRNGDSACVFGGSRLSSVIE